MVERSRERSLRIFIRTKFRLKGITDFIRSKIKGCVKTAPDFEGGFGFITLECF